MLDPVFWDLYTSGLCKSLKNQNLSQSHSVSNPELPAELLDVEQFSLVDHGNHMSLYSIPRDVVLCPATAVISYHHDCVAWDSPLQLREKKIKKHQSEATNPNSESSWTAGERVSVLTENSTTQTV